MLKKRVICSLLLDDKRIVKGKKFKNHRYIGDPINIVRILNEKKCDELLIYNIKNNKLNLPLIKRIIDQAFMPITLIGGINSIEIARNLWKIGIEKIGFNFNKTNPELISNIADIFGSQSIVLNMDIYKSKLGGFKIYKDKYKFFKRSQRMDLLIKKSLEKFKNNTIGELLIQNVDREGTRKGADLDFINEICNSKLDIPIIYSGGLNTLQEMDKALENSLSGLSCGAGFCFYGEQAGVLIRYFKPASL